MVDRHNIERHLVVKKEKEITHLENAGKTEILDEEILFQALGTSIFEVLKENNLIFEGWTDKKLFSEAIKYVKGPEKEEIKEYLKCKGLTHAYGLKNIKYIASIMELAERCSCQWESVPGG